MVKGEYKIQQAVYAGFLEYDKNIRMKRQQTNPIYSSFVWFMSNIYAPKLHNRHVRFNIFFSYGLIYSHTEFSQIHTVRGEEIKKENVMSVRTFLNIKSGCVFRLLFSVHYV